jgi:carboxylesterase type B
MKLHETLLLLDTALIGIAAGPSADPTVVLEYGTFQGKYNPTYDVTLFRRIPFAAPPTGRNRFGAPRPPARIDAVYDADRDFPACPQGEDQGSEDCLYLGLYSRPWTNNNNNNNNATTTANRRPVVVFFHGDGFVRGAAAVNVPPAGYPTLDVDRRNDFVMVYPNHRLNAFGFLPGKKLRDSADSALNPGLLDQEYALKWVRKNIAR